MLIFKLVKKDNNEEAKHEEETPKEDTNRISFKNNNKGNKKVEIKSIKADINNSDIDKYIDLFKLEEKNKTLKEDILKEFDYDYKSIIKEFLRVLNDSNNSKFCNVMRTIFTSDTIYNIKTSNDELEETKRVLNNKQYEKILNAYMSINKRFNLEDFIVYLDELVMLNDKQITIYVGNDNDIELDEIDEDIRIEKDENIYEGIKIKYQSRIYDFSLNGRD